MTILESMIVWILVALGLFIFVNWLGRHSKIFGYDALEQLSDPDTAPVFNFLFRVATPIVLLLVISLILYLLKLDRLVENIHYSVYIYILFRLSFNLVRGRKSLLPWPKLTFQWITIIFLANFAYHNLIFNREFLVPNIETIGNEVWLAIVAYTYIVASNVRHDDTSRNKRVENYISKRAKYLKKKYGSIIDDHSSKNLVIEALTLSIMIIEDFNRPQAYRVIERLLFLIKKSHTLGIMQVKTPVMISDRESIRIGIEKIKEILEKSLENKDEWQASENLKNTLKKQTCDAHEESAIIHNILTKYNPSGDYARDVAHVLDVLREDLFANFKQDLRILIDNCQNLNSTDNIYEIELVEEVLPDIKIAPDVMWSSFIGVQSWKNTPLVLDDFLYVGYAGRKWNENDELDGIYCVSQKDGRIEWHTKSNSDLNGLVACSDFLIGGTDHGEVICVERYTGKNLWRRLLKEAVVTKPIIIGNRNLFILTYNGTALILNIENGRTKSTLKLAGHFMSDATYVESENYILAPSTDGQIFILSASSNKISFDRFFQFCYNSFTAESAPVFYSPPVKYGSLWIQAYCRNSYYPEPALIAFNLKTGFDEIVWRGSDSRKLHDTYANIRSAPLVVGDEIVFAAAYSKSIFGIDGSSGNVNWRTPLGETIFEQWASPVASGKFIYSPRHDGYLYAVNRETKNKEWSLFLGKHDSIGCNSKNKFPEFDGELSISSSDTPLLSTPKISSDGKSLFVGTAEGYLHKIQID